MFFGRGKNEVKKIECKIFMIFEYDGGDLGLIKIVEWCLVFEVF